MKSYVQEISDKFGINYYDFSCDSILSNDYKYFRNADHLNDMGKKKFTIALTTL